MKARTITSSLRSALALSALLWLGDLPEAEAGVDVWTSRGPYGGSMEFLAIDPQTPTTLYAGNARSVFKSTDGGGTWSAISFGFTSVFTSNFYINAFAIDPQTPTTVYVGTYGGAGVAKSMDGGASWTAANAGLTSPEVNALAIDPRTPTTLYAGTASKGVFKSTDGGSTWSGDSSGLFHPVVEVLAIDPQTPTTLYAVIGSGVLKSTDGGRSWRGSGPPGRATSDLAIDPQTPTTLYAAAGGVFKSTDGGSTWSAVNTQLIPGALAIDPRTPTTLYASTSSGVFKSTDGGSTWSAVNAGLTSPSVTSVAIDPQTPSTLYAGTVPDSTVAGAGGGVFKSSNGGDSWSPANTGLTGLSASSVLVDAQTPTTLYAVAAGSRLFKSLDSGNAWSEVSRGTFPIIAQTPAALYAASYGVAKSTDGGVSWTRSCCTPWGVSSLAIDPQSLTTLYAGTYNNGVWKSTDDGASWTYVSTGLGGTGGRRFSVAIDPQTPTTLYAGGFGSGVFKSTNGGSSWSAVNAGLTRLCVTSVAIDPQTPTTLYAGTGSCWQGSGQTSSFGVFKSTNGGENWVDVGLTDLEVSVLVIDPQTPTTLYAGTAGGVFKSTDRGDNWSALNTGLTDLWVRALAIDPQTPTTLYAGTWMGVFAIRQTTVGGAVTTTVNFDTPAPRGGPGPLDGVFGGIDFGAGQWAWEGPYGVGPTNNIYFGDSTGTSRTFAFSPALRVLNSMSVFSPEPGTLTLSDDAGQTHSREVTAGSMQRVTTGWTRPSTTVTVSFTAGWALGIDDITYTTAP